MGELGIVIIVGCCPYIPRIVRRHRGTKTTQLHSNQNTGSEGMSIYFFGKFPFAWSWPTSWGSRPAREDTNQSRWSGDYARGEEFITRAAIVEEP